MGKIIYSFLLIILTGNFIYAENIKNTDFEKKVLKRKQILLTNEMEYKDGQSSSGASAFLIHYNGEIYAVTAKHLLGKAMGIVPEVLPSNFNSEIKEWTLFRRYSPNEKLTVKKLISEDNNMSNDVILFQINEIPRKTHPLKVSTEKLIENKKYYLIGCPYKETTCNQNIYRISYKEKQHNMEIFTLESKLELSGFSGAPIVDEKGDVVSILVAGWANNTIGSIDLRTVFKNIEQIK